MKVSKKIFFLILFVTVSISAQTDSIAVDLGKEGLFVFVSTQALSVDTPDENGAVKARVLRRESSSGNFEQTATAQMAGSVEEFFAAMGVENTDTVSNIDSIWTTLKQNPMIEDYGFDAINPDFLTAMGAGYYDTEVNFDLEYQYKVEYLDSQNNVVKESYSKFISPSEEPNISKPKYDELIKSDSSAIITWNANKIADEESFFVDLFYQVNGEADFNVIKNIALKRESEENYVYQTVLSPLKKENYYRVYIKPKNFLDRYGPSSDTTEFFFVDYNQLELMGKAAAVDSSIGIYLSWEKIEQKPYYLGIEIERSTDLVSGYSVLDTVSISQTEYYDKKVEDKQTYYYRFTPLLTEDTDLPFQANASATYTGENNNLMPPYNLTVSKKTDVVSLSWNSENDPFGYNVYRSVNFQEDGEIVASNLKEKSYVDSISILTQGRDYVYYVTSINEDNIESPASNKVSIKTTDDNPPPVIKELTGYAEEYRIRLTWEDLRKDYTKLAGYNVYRKSSKGKDFQKINKELVEPNFFDDESVEQGEKYTYYVSAVNFDNLESSSSNKAAFSIKEPILAAPQSINARSTSEGIEISWSNVLDDRITAYKIYRQSEGDQQQVEIGVVKARKSSFVDSSVSEGKLYHYSIKAESADSESEYSPIKSERYSQ